MAKKSAKLGWSDTEELAFRLIDEHPDVNPQRMSAETLVEMVLALPDFGDRNKKPAQDTLEDIQARWYEERSEMEDELGPMSDFSDEESLDEDEYRDDRLAEDSEEEDTLSFEESYSEDDDDEDEEEYY